MHKAGHNQSEIAKVDGTSKTDPVVNKWEYLLFTKQHKDWIIDKESQYFGKHRQQFHRDVSESCLPQYMVSSFKLSSGYFMILGDFSYNGIGYQIKISEIINKEFGTRLIGPGFMFQ